MFSDGSADAWDLLWAIPDQIVVEPPIVPEKAIVVRRVAPSFVGDRHHSELSRLPSDCIATGCRTYATNTSTENVSSSTTLTTSIALTEAPSSPDAASGAPTARVTAIKSTAHAITTTPSSPVSSDGEPECAGASAPSKPPCTIVAAPAGSTATCWPPCPSPDSRMLMASAPSAPLSQLGSTLAAFSTDSLGALSDDATVEAVSSKLPGGSRCCSITYGGTADVAVATETTASTLAEVPAVHFDTVHVLEVQHPLASAQRAHAAAAAAGSLKDTLHEVVNRSLAPALGLGAPSAGAETTAVAPVLGLVGATEAPVAVESDSASETNTAAVQTATATTSVGDLPLPDGGALATAATATAPMFWSPEALRCLHCSRDPRRQLPQAYGEAQEHEHQQQQQQVAECSGEAQMQPHIKVSGTTGTGTAETVVALEDWRPYAADPLRRRSYTLGGSRLVEQQASDRLQNHVPCGTPAGCSVPGADVQSRSGDGFVCPLLPSDDVRPLPPQATPATAPPAAATAIEAVARSAGVGLCNLSMLPLRPGPKTTSSRLLSRLRPTAAATVAAAAPAARQKSLKRFGKAGNAGGAAGEKAKGRSSRRRAEALLSEHPAALGDAGGDVGDGDDGGAAAAAGQGAYGATGCNSEPESILQRIHRALEAADGLTGDGGRVPLAARRGAGGVGMVSGRIIADDVGLYRTWALPPPRGRFDFRLRRRRGATVADASEVKTERGSPWKRDTTGVGAEVEEANPSRRLPAGDVSGSAAGACHATTAAPASVSDTAAVAAAAGCEGEKRKSAAAGSSGLEQALVEWRSRRARTVRKTPEAFLRRGLLQDLAARCPTSVLCLEDIPGLPRPWVRKYGQEVLDLCRNFMHLEAARVEAAATAARARRAAAAATVALRKPRPGDELGIGGDAVEAQAPGRSNAAQQQESPRLGPESEGAAAAGEQPPRGVAGAGPAQHPQQPEPRGAAGAGAPAGAASDGSQAFAGWAGEGAGFRSSWSWRLGPTKGTAAVDPRARMRQQLLGLLGLEDGPSLKQQLLNGAADEGPDSRRSLPGQKRRTDWDGHACAWTQGEERSPDPAPRQPARTAPHQPVQHTATRPDAQPQPAGSPLVSHRGKALVAPAAHPSAPKLTPPAGAGSGYGTGTAAAQPSPPLPLAPEISARAANTKAHIAARRLARMGARAPVPSPVEAAPMQLPLQSATGPCDDGATADKANAAAATVAIDLGLKGAEQPGAAPGRGTISPVPQQGTREDVPVAAAPKGPDEPVPQPRAAASAKRPYYRKRHHQEHREDGIGKDDVEEAYGENGGRRVVRRMTSSSDSPRSSKAGEAAASAAARTRRRGRPARSKAAVAEAAEAATAGGASGWVPPPAGCRVRGGSQLAYAATPAVHHVRVHDLLGILAEAGRTAEPFLEEGSAAAVLKERDAAGSGDRSAATAAALPPEAPDLRNTTTTTTPSNNNNDTPSSGVGGAASTFGAAVGTEPAVAMLPAAALVAAAAFQRLGRVTGQDQMRRLRSMAEAALPAWEVRRVLACRALGAAAQAAAVLRLPPGASRNEVRVAFRRLSLLVHPDKNRSAGAAEAFALVSAAANRLLGKGP